MIVPKQEIKDAIAKKFADEGMKIDYTLVEKLALDSKTNQVKVTLRTIKDER